MNVVVQDDTLPHQIRVYQTSSRGILQTSCVCRKNGNGYIPFGVHTTTEEAKRLYNRGIHDPAAGEFGPEHLLWEA